MRLFLIFLYFGSFIWFFDIGIIFIANVDALIVLISQRRGFHFRFAGILRIERQNGPACAGVKCGVIARLISHDLLLQKKGAPIQEPPEVSFIQQLLELFH
jgi:hypothetical protein